MGTLPGSAGGFLIQPELAPAADPLFAPSIIGRVGVPTIELSGNASVPRGTGAITTTWQAADGTSVASTDSALGSVSVVAKTLLATVSVSLQVLKQAPSIADFLSRLLLRSVRSALDQALLQGSGGSGQPLGLAHLPTDSGIQSVSGSSLAWSGILSAQQKACTAGVSDESVRWVGATTARETLAAREKISTSGRFIWEDNEIAGAPAYATPDCPSASLFVGDFANNALLALFGPGIEIRYDESGGFNTGQIAFQIMCLADIAFTQPAAFVRITSLS